MRNVSDGQITCCTRRFLQSGFTSKTTVRGREDDVIFTAMAATCRSAYGRPALRTFMRLSCTGASHLSQLKRPQRAIDINTPQKSRIRRWSSTTERGPPSAVALPAGSHCRDAFHATLLRLRQRAPD